jgi:hypothetical protein
MSRREDDFMSTRGFPLVVISATAVTAYWASNAEYTVYWSPLSPVNEQLRSAEDPWLLWVRQQVK